MNLRFIEYFHALNSTIYEQVSQFESASLKWSSWANKLYNDTILFVYNTIAQYFKDYLLLISFLHFRLESKIWKNFNFQARKI